jgi:uncharacterized protein
MTGVSKSHEFSIPASELDAGGKDYDFTLRAAWIRGALEGHEATAAGNDGKLTLRASKSGNDVVLHGQLTADLELPCARCLQPVKVHLDQPFSALAVPAKALRSPEGEEYQFEAEEADVMAYEGETVVLDDAVRDELVLELPMIPLCREDCPGMSPPSGKTEEERKAVDPRLAPLLRLKNLKKE